MQRSGAAHRKQTLTYMWMHIPSLGVDGGKGAEMRDSSELWGEGCDHSVAEYYCQNTHMQGKVHTTMCVYKLMKG